MAIKYLIIFFIFFIQLITINAKTLFVNGVTGNDSESGFNGSTEKTAFKSIQKAVDNAEVGDMIAVEGINKGKEIVYNEKVNIEGKSNLTLKGNNKPAISGKNKALIKPPYVGITIGNGDVKIIGFRVSDFLGESIPNIGFTGGAAIYSKSGNTGVEIEDNEIRNCNWGIIFYETEASIINANKIDSIHQAPTTDLLNGGVGIMLFAKRKFIQGVEIGTKRGNIISNADKAAIFMGSNDSITVADLTKIENNYIIFNAGIGIVANNFTGMVSIQKNQFDGNFAALSLGGFMMDTFIGKNSYNGSISSSEIITNASFDGSFLYDIRKNNNNIFKIPTYAAIDKDKNSIQANKDHRYIRNKENEAKSDIGKEGQLDKLQSQK